MLDKLFFTCNAILPIILLIVLGYVLKSIKLFPESFFKTLNKLCFRICLPVLLFFNIYKVENLNAIGENWQIILYAALSIVSIFLIGVIIALIFVKDDKQKGVIAQCCFRSNYALIGIPLAEALSNGDPIPVGLASIVSAISIPLFNILAIIALSIFVKDENGGKISVKKIVLNIVKNPLIIGVFSGLVALGIRALIPVNEEGMLVFSIQNDIPFLYKAISQVAQIASPAALIALGGTFTFAAIKKLKFQIILGTTLRVLFVPLLGLVIAYFLGFRQNEFPALIALFGTPVAVSSVPMSAEMGNDDELAGQLVVWTSIFSAFSLFVMILICAQIGIFAV